MEKTNSDVKMEIMKTLPGVEILKVCQTSKEMYKVCKDKRYDPLWKLKIKEEFFHDYRGDNAFQKYKDLRKLYNTTLYVVIDNNERGEIVGTFDTREKAEEAIISRVVEDEIFTYSQLKYSIKSEKFGYTIEETYLSNPGEIEKSLKEEFEKEREELYKMYDKEVPSLFPLRGENDKNIFFAALDDLMYQANDSNHINEKIDKFIKNFCKNMGLEKKFDIIKEYVYSNILMEDSPY